MRMDDVIRDINRDAYHIVVITSRVMIEDRGDIIHRPSIHMIKT